MFKSLVATGVMLLLATTAFARASAGSLWTNQRGSELTIADVDGDGKISGTYVNRDPAHPRCNGSPYPLTGWTDGTQYVFSVRWTSAAEDCKSIASWVGFLDGNTLKTEWSLVYTGKDGKSAVEKGTDDFAKK